LNNILYTSCLDYVPDFQKFQVSSVRWFLNRCKSVSNRRLVNSFIHSGDLYRASSRGYYSEALPAQTQTKEKNFKEM